MAEWFTVKQKPFKSRKIMFACAFAESLEHSQSLNESQAPAEVAEDVTAQL